MKSRTYNYRLKHLSKTLAFSLEVNSEAHVLFNELLRKNRRRKNPITYSINQVLKWAKEYTSNKGIQNTTFINMIEKEVGESPQKIFDRVFQLALNRYAQLQADGRMPTLISHRIPQEVKPIPRPTPKPRPRPQPQPTAKREPLDPTSESKRDMITALIPKDLQENVKVEYNTKTQTIIITIIKRVDAEGFMALAKVCKKYHGTYHRWTPNSNAYFIIPSENI